jgi:hypothetical protein
VTVTLVFSMGCHVLVPLPDYTELCQKAAVFIFFFMVDCHVSLPRCARCKI